MAPGFGCSAGYTVGLFSRMSGALICLLDERADISWGRRLDRSSTAQVTIRDDCCSCIPIPWAHEIGIYRDGQDQPVWQGPVTGPTEQTGRQLVIAASDKSGYWYRRDTSLVHSHAGAPVDAGTLFANLVADAETGVPSGLIFTPVSPTGTMVERTINTSEKIGPHLDDLANDGIDWTVVGLQCYAGGVTISAGGALPLETRDHWEDPPTVTSDGRQQATRVLVHAQGSILGVWPPGPPVVDPVFGILEEDISRPNIANQAEADAYAQSYYLRHQGPVVGITTGQSVLSKRFPYGMADLIPGRLFNVLVNTECQDTLLTLRLAELNVDASNGAETAVRIDLQPVGQMDPVEAP